MALIWRTSHASLAPLLLELRGGDDAASVGAQEVGRRPEPLSERQPRLEARGLLDQLEVALRSRLRRRGRLVRFLGIWRGVQLQLAPGTTGR